MYIHDICHMKRPAVYIVKYNVAVYWVSEDREAALNSTRLYSVRRKVLECFPVIGRIYENVSFPAVIVTRNI